MSNLRSITPLPDANFTPELGNYKTLQPFRYWCQKVLPLVYDDSLSYYELLCKVVDYLNKTMEDVETLHGDVTNLHTAYEELQAYVNNYFSTLDVQEEINNKLDNMANSGVLYEIIRRYTDPIVNEQNEKINVLNSRMSRAELARMCLQKLGGFQGRTQGSAMLSETEMAIYCPAENEQQNGALKRMNIRTGEVLQQNAVQAYHGNTMVYFNGLIYMTMGDTNPEPIDTVLKIDPTTLEVIDTINLTGHGLTNSVQSLATDGTYLYATDFKTAEQIPVDVYDDSLTFVRTVYLKNPYASIVRQSMFCYDGMLCVVTSTANNNIICFDAITGDLVKVIKFEEYFNTGFKVHEVEDCTVVGDILYCNAVAKTSAKSAKIITSIGFVNLRTGSPTADQPSWAFVYGNAQTDNPYTANGTANKPYATLDECLCTKYNVVQWYGDYPNTVYLDNRHLTINAHSGTIKAISLQENALVYLTNATLTNGAEALRNSQLRMASVKVGDVTSSYGALVDCGGAVIATTNGVVGKIENFTLNDKEGLNNRNVSRCKIYLDDLEGIGNDFAYMFNVKATGVDNAWGNLMIPENVGWYKTKLAVGTNYEVRGEVDVIVRGTYNTLTITGDIEYNSTSYAYK